MGGRSSRRGLWCKWASNQHGRRNNA
jgi:hypothetical protein